MLLSETKSLYIPCLSLSSVQTTLSSQSLFGNKISLQPLFKPFSGLLKHGNKRLFPQKFHNLPWTPQLSLSTAIDFSKFSNSWKQDGNKISLHRLFKHVYEDFVSTCLRLFPKNRICIRNCLPDFSPFRSKNRPFGNKIAADALIKLIQTLYPGENGLNR